MEIPKRYLPSQPIRENEDFAIYGNDSMLPYAETLLMLLRDEKRRILEFFRMNFSEKIDVNLFDKQKDLINYTKQFYNPAPYSRGNFIDKTINFSYEQDVQNCNIYYLRSSIIHEFVHIVYREWRKDLYERVIWLDEGLAQNLSRERSLLEKEDSRFEEWYKEAIVAPSKCIPDISFLKRHGNKFGEYVDGEKNSCSGYDLSYLLVRFLLESEVDFFELLSNFDAIRELEIHIMRDCIAYYNDKFHIETSPRFEERPAAEKAIK